MNIKLNETYTTEEGKELICYEKTEKFAFLCPYRLLDENRVELNIKETFVYSMQKQDETPIEAIETLLVES
jgi:hypothetical protein